MAPRRRTTSRLAAATGATAVLAVAAALVVAGCGGHSASPDATLHRYLDAWRSGQWSRMRALVADPPADFTQVNAHTFAALGVSRVGIDAGAVTTAKDGASASAPITERYAIAHEGTWSPASTVHLVKRRGRWLVQWSPRTIEPQLGAGDALSLTRTWPQRAPILGAGGAPLTDDAQRVAVGVVGQRITNPAAVRADLLAAGAPASAVTTALAAAKAHPTQFEPVFTVSQARFARLKTAAGPHNVYAVKGTQFQQTSGRTAITQQLGTHLIGTLGPITAEQLKSLGAPYDSSSTVGQTGLEASQERTLAGTPTTRIDVVDPGGNPLARLRTWPGHAGTAVHTSLDPRIQKAAEAALATSTRRNVAIVAMRASTGAVLAVASRPVAGYDTALQGAYPPGSTFKVLISTQLLREGMSPSSPASCPPGLTVDGEPFHNAEGDAPVSTIAAAFTESCNTAFIQLALAHVSAAEYPAVAALYGLDRTPHMGVTAFSANVPRPRSRRELAAAAIGQGRVTFSPLGMAQVASAIDSGVVRAPRLVTGAADDRVGVSHLPAGVLAGLRSMMASVTTSGTAAGFGLPAGTHAKTGTAEYGTGPESSLKIDGWLMGYSGDIAFAIVTQDTGGADGGPVDAPIVAKFFGALR